MVEPAILISALALGLSAIGFFYKLGRDTKGERENDSESGKLDQIYDRIEDIGGKVDKIIEWQQTAHGIHEKQREQIKTLFNNIERIETKLTNIDGRLNDREVLNKSLEKILERLS